jgi:Capsular polysaccharide synthesis protein/Glycosyl transferase family 2
MSTLASFSNAHLGETILVCGCGQSLSELEQPERFITIGVNDIGRRFHPDYLVVVNPPDQFSGDRFRYVESSEAKFIFTQLDLNLCRENVIKFSLGTHGGADFSNPDVLHYTQNSPYVALCLAVRMGAKRIGLIGVDFTPHHFFAATGTHSLASQLSIIDEQYRRLDEAIRRQGGEVFNISRTSRLTAFPKMSIEEFAEQAHRSATSHGRSSSSSDEATASFSLESSASLQVISYATTPVAGVPAILARCINARTPHRARCVWAARGYGNGVIFEGDIEWTTAPGEAAEALKAADVVILHNGKVDDEHRALLAGKAIVTMAHNYGWNVDESFVKQGFPGVVVGQYQATLPEFKDWLVVPNPIPLWEEAFMPETKGQAVTICYTPSGRHECYPPSHKLYWHSKGYETTMRTLERLASNFSIRMEVIGGDQVSHDESLAMKRRSHILIDECVTGSYHRNSLEGLAAGCVVVNGMGLLPGVQDILSFCAGGAARVPFVHASLDKMGTVLASLIERGAETLARDGASNRQWMESHWDFARQWKQFWLPVVKKSLERVGCKRSVVEVSQEILQTTGRTNVSRGVEMIKSKEGVSVIIPHGGRERLPHLTATLVNLQQCQGLNEIIVVDMGEAPYAEEIARRFADKYVFVYHRDAFQRARALNIGTPFAEYDLLLWNDNDLLLPVDFIETAAAELRARQLDNLIPYTDIRYLSEADSKDVMAGTSNPNDCKHVNLFRSRYDASGGCGLVRKAFVLEYGGLHEGFRGWGGDDNAWSFKAQLLGRSSATQSSDRHIYHLFHAHSGGYGGNSHIAQNPHYNDNVALMNQITSARERDEFIKRFPPTEHFSCPWGKEKHVAFITDDSSATSQHLARRIAQTLADLYAVKIESHCAVCADRHWEERLLERTPDAIVIFGQSLAKQLMTNRRLAYLWSKVLIVQKEWPELNEDELKSFSLAGAILTADANVVRSLEEAGLPVWVWASAAEGDHEVVNDALSLAQPLSIILGGRVSPPRPKVALAPDNADKHLSLPVWLYWENECPEWIKTCQQTIFAHATDVRLVTPDEFQRLRDVDSDIDLKRLHAAHRADFIRAFLLAKFGGFWVDSDCLVMQPLQPLLNLLNSNDFIFHKERSGYVSNGFIGARPGSKIASTLYRRLCEILRSGRQLGWTSLGSEPLSEIIKTCDVPYYELPCESIQPICWSQPEAFFKINDSLEHERIFDEQAICYMLSNNSIQKFQATNRTRNLLDEGTFFRYLSKRALDKEEKTTIGNNNSGGASRWQQIPFCIEAMVDVAPLKVLDVGIGFGRWGMLIREFCGSGKNAEPGGDRRVLVVGIETLRTKVAEHTSFFYDQIHFGGGVEVIEKMDDRWNLVIFDEVPQDWDVDVIEKAFVKALDTSDYVLVSSSVVMGLRALRDSHRMYRHKLSSRLSYLLSVNLVRHAVPDGRHAKAEGALLLSRSDPKGLRRAEPMQRIFERIIENNLKVGDESVSGPGSCLAQTTEIRRRLPFLIADLKIRSFLDTPCGDFNWMKHVRLGTEQYIGGDIVPTLVEQNQRIFGDSERRFIHLDITRDYLPQVDLIFCRDCLVHFPLTEIANALTNFKRSQSKYLLTTTFTGQRENTEITTGEWRPLNLQLSPFNFPPPLRLINEKCAEVNGTYADKCLGLWRLEDIPF